ncbi:reverse transcriptase domain-containing protein [Tanacetum coccineum]
MEKVVDVAYKLELPEELSRVHNTFHVSNLKKCHTDEPLAVLLDGLHVDEKLHFVTEPVEIVDREVKWLKQIRIPLVKVRWNSKQCPEFTWEREDQFRKKDPHLFSKTALSSRLVKGLQGIMPPRKAPRTKTTPATTTNTTSVTNAQLQAMIDQGLLPPWQHVMLTKQRSGETSYFRNQCTEGLNALPRTSALTWWNSHVMTVGHDVAYAMNWTDLRKKITDKYCPRNEMKKLEAELWNLKVKGNHVIGYSQRFQELALLCVLIVPEECDKVERYVDGLPDMIHGSVVASKPKTMQEATEMETELMDKKISTLAERQAENKRKLDNNNQAQQQTPKRQNVAPHTRWD